MKNIFQNLSVLLFLTVGGAIASSFGQKGGVPFRFPYQKTGLSQREAAAHLLSRFSFGIMPDQVDDVAKSGLENWFETQLNGRLPDKQVEEMLSGYESLKMSAAEIVQTYPRSGQVSKMAIKDGIVAKDSAKGKENKKAIQDYMQQKNLRPQSELFKQLINQKIIRAAYSNNQLTEVLTDFWFNHFNVAISKGGLVRFVTTYERDAIRPNVLGDFETLLLATAKSPAMLIYLDNKGSTVTEEARMEYQKKRAGKGTEMTDIKMQAKGKIKKRKMQGLNENYAREVMELHTMGVDGGYTQSDVTGAARVLTGWSLNPEIEYSPKPKRQVNEEGLKKLGVVVEGDFVFAAGKHDRGEKKVLGQTFPAGGGYEEGLRLLHMLATHPSTATFISRKLAVRFVSDNPPQALVDKMAKTFSNTHGNIKEVLITMVSAPEFWGKEALREKTKAPFELAISAVRTTGAAIEAPYPLYQWMTKMGQKMYNYQAPTGFPDRGQYWISTGSILNRMNFGLALASGRIAGIKLNLLALNGNHEPESAEAALQIYTKLLLPEQDVAQITKRLTPMLHDPALQKKVAQAAGKTASAKAAMQDDEAQMIQDDTQTKEEAGKHSEKRNSKKDSGEIKTAAGNNSMLAQVAGIIIGSPEFQRR